VSTLRAEFPVRLLCGIIGLAPSTFYYAGQPAAEVELRDAIEQIALAFPRYGYRRMTAELHRRGWAINHKHVLRLMREENLLADIRRLCRTTDSRHGQGRYPNRIRGLAIVRPDQAWAADLTYIRLPREFVYLAVVLDVFTRAVRGWALGRSLTADLPKAALERALARGRPAIHHSDQGVQYAAAEYVRVLTAAGVQLSMAAAGQPTQNAHVERWMRTLKEEEVYLNDYQTLAGAEARIGPFIEEVYNQKRVHSALGYQTPAEFEAAWWAAQPPRHTADRSAAVTPEAAKEVIDGAEGGSLAARHRPRR
jgi:transposase InsO family protein